MFFKQMIRGVTIWYNLGDGERFILRISPEAKEVEGKTRRATVIMAIIMVLIINTSEKLFLLIRLTVVKLTRPNVAKLTRC